MPRFGVILCVTLVGIEHRTPDHERDALSATHAPITHKLPIFGENHTVDICDILKSSFIVRPLFNFRVSLFSVWVSLNLMGKSSIAQKCWNSQ